MFEKSFDIALRAYSSYARYLWEQITHPGWGNYVYWLLVVSIAFFLFELFRPWRKDQARFRKDFWLDAFYMLFNFFIFSLIIYNAASEVVVHWFEYGLNALGVTHIPAVQIASWPAWAQLLTLFFVRDFIQWNIHRLLHRVPWLWEFHKVHHSVEEMGFAAHLRYHWVENVVYRVLEYLPLAMIGYGITEFFIVHAVAIVIGHFNHSNLRLPLGPLKYILNNPQMHIWHHAKKMPKNHRYGMNYGISLSLWDYLFGTACIPHDGRDIPLGFDGMKKFPKTFLSQAVYGFRRKKEEDDV